MVKVNGSNFRSHAERSSIETFNVGESIDEAADLPSLRLDRAFELRKSDLVVVEKVKETFDDPTTNTDFDVPDDETVNNVEEGSQ